MDIAQLIQTLVATVVGGLIVIATNWISAKGKRREAIQEWYERTYIAEGIDPLLAYYQHLAFSIVDKSNGYAVRFTEKDVPVEALGKVRVLLNDYTPLNIILNAHAHLAHTTDMNMLGEVANSVQDAVEALLDFRLELTRVVSEEVQNKHYIADVSRLAERLNEANEELKRLEEQRIAKRDELEDIRQTEINPARRNAPHMKRRKIEYPQV